MTFSHPPPGRAAPSRGSAGSPEAPVAGPRTTILVVDDIPAVREVTRLALEGAGYAVLEADDGEAALAAIEARCGRVDLVLTDVAMPGMDGTALARETHSRWPHIPILFVSANRAFRPPPGPRGEVDAFLPKPYRPAQVVRVVAEELAHHARVA